jgi:hypothetical protein
VTGVPVSEHPDDAILSAYHDGELRGFARADVEQHLAQCPRCRRALGEMDALDGALRALPELDPPSGSYGAILARVERARPRRRRRLAWAIGALVAAAAAIAGGYDLFGAQQHALLPAASPPAATNGAARARVAPSAGGAALSPSSAQGDLLDPNSHAHVARSYGALSPGDQAKVPALRSSAGPAVASGTAPQPGTIDARLIARTGEVDLQVRDVQGTFEKVGLVAAREGGYVSGSNNNAMVETSGAYSATVTLRVPAANFQATIDALTVLPHTAMSEQSTSSDITDSYHDLQAQLQALEATRGQLMALMSHAHSVHDALSVLGQLTGVNTNIDTVQSQIMSSANSVMLSTINVNLTQKPRQQIVVAPVRKPKQWQPGRDLSAALTNLLHAGEAAISLAIYAAVYLAVPALVLGILWATRRRRLPAER